MSVDRIAVAPTAQASPTGPTPAPSVAGEWMTARIAGRKQEADGIISLLLEADSGTPLPAYEAGAHIDVDLGGGFVRQYSLCSTPALTQSGLYRLGILLDPRTRGGSGKAHAELHEGKTLRIGQPRNLFRLAPEARQSILLAGGIGITPLLAMAYALQGRRQSFSLHYAVRSLERAAFRDEIRQAFPDQAVIHADDADGAPSLDLAGIVGKADPRAHIYCCGPAGFIDHAVEIARTAQWPEAQIHLERFSADNARPGQDFSIVTARSGVEVRVAGDQSILQALLDAGLDIPFSCETGVCGTCICPVIDGIPDHRDQFLTDAEKTRNDSIAVCCSRARSPRLILDI